VRRVRLLERMSISNAWYSAALGRQVEMTPLTELMDAFEPEPAVQSGVQMAHALRTLKARMQRRLN